MGRFWRVGAMAGVDDVPRDLEGSFLAKKERQQIRPLPTGCKLRVESKRSPGVLWFVKEKQLIASNKKMVKWFWDHTFQGFLFFATGFPCYFHGTFLPTAKLSGVAISSGRSLRMAASQCTGAGRQPPLDTPCCWEEPSFSRWIF